jgi:hypothetical protein
MSKARWIMKQYWRISAIRAWMGLALGMFSLGKVYVAQTPGLAELGLIGALILGSVLVLVFLGVGWLYDVKGKMWSPNMQALIERDPYNYIPNYKTYAIDYPIVYALVSTFRNLLQEKGFSTERLDDVSIHNQKYFNRAPEREDIIKSEASSVSFFEKHPFLDETRPKKRVSFTAKSKLEFEVIQLRLDWIQQLTGMLQDSLIFAAVYVVLIFPGVAVDNVVPIPFLILGFLLLSIPMLFIITLSGWYYDKKLRIWSPDMIVKVERTPYTYVAYPRLYVMDLPAYYALLDTMKMIMEKQGIEPFEIERIIEYMNTYCDFKSSREQDMEKARALRREYGEVFVTKEVE